MESVEVWMWIIAGIMVGGMIFASSFVFLGRYIHNMEISDAQESINSLKTVFDRVCLSGIRSQESVRLVFPYIVNRIYVESELGVKGEGDKLCLEIKGEDKTCKNINVCTVTMRSVELERSTSAFYAIDKILGSKRPGIFRFVVSKPDKARVEADWKPTIETE